MSISPQDLQSDPQDLQQLGAIDQPNANSIDDLLFEIERLPQWRKRWSRRLSESRFDNQTWQPVMLAELEKVKRGGSPYSDVEAVQALRALQGQGAPVAEPEGFLGTARRDLSMVVKALAPWHLIPALAKEPLKAIAAVQGEPVTALDQATFGDVLKSLAPGQQMQTPPGVEEPTGLMKAANFPLARFVPGFGTAARIAAGPKGWKEIKEHPVFTALDIAPYAAKLVAPALGSALRQVYVPDWLSVKAQSSPYMLMRGVELPGAISNTGRSILLEAVMGAGRTGRPLAEVLGGLGHSAEFGPKLSWGSFLERVRSYPGRRFGFGLEEQAISRLYVQTQRRYVRTFEELYTGTKPEGVRKLLGMEAKTPALRAATELIGKWDDPEWVKGAYDHLSGIHMLDELENAIGVWRETGKFNLDPKVMPDDLAEFKNYVESAYEDPHIPLYDPATGQVTKYISPNDVAVEFSRELRRTYDLDLPQEWGAEPLAPQVADGIMLSPDKRAGGAWDRLQMAVHRAFGKDPGTAAYERAIALVRDRVRQFNKAFTSEAPSPYRELARAYVEKKTGLPLENWMDETEWIKQAWMEDRMKTTGVDWDGARQAWDSVRDELLDEATPEGLEWAEAYRTKFAGQSEALRDINASWTFLWDSGVRPTWLHQVHYGSEFAAGRLPALLPQKVASASAWMADSTRVAREYYKDYRLGMTHYAMETLRYLHGMENVVQLEQAFGRPQIEVFRQLLDFHKGDTRLAQIAYDKNYRSWFPSSAYTFRRVRVGNRLAEKSEAFTAADKAAMQEMAIPVSVVNTLEKLSPRGRPFGLPATYDKAMNLWRMSILGLRPTWNINNIVGGMVMLMARTGPDVFGTFRDALRMVREDTMPNAISQSRIVELLTDVSPGAEAARSQFAFGRTMGRLWTTLREPFRFNEFVDNLYRSMAYLQGTKKGLAKGLSKEAASEQGIRLANKVLQDWDALTPIEQQIFRQIFPFYGWAKHITRYVMSYPWDHPLRASFLGNLSRVVVNGADPTLSDRFNFGILKFGDLNGKVLGLPVAALNPFQDVNRVMSLAGFMSYLNPALQLTLESMGVDPRDARQEAFPELVYDVEAGRLVAARPGFGQAIISLFPQVEALGTWAQITESSRELWKDNPEAARAQVIQRFGLPVPRQYSLSEERVKEAVARHRALRAGLVEAMKGRPDKLAGYVGGREQAEKIAGAGKAISAQTQGKITYDQILLLLQLTRHKQGYGLQ